MLYQNRHITEIGFTDPYLNLPWKMIGSNLLVRGTIGAGDFMFTMCTAAYVANILKTNINVIFYWSHDLDYQHHFEDPESIFEKIDWFHSIIHNNHTLTYEHVINADLEKMFKGKMIKNLERTDIKGVMQHLPKGLNSWKFKDHLYTQVIAPKRVCVWRSTFNAETPSTWKTSYTNEDWNRAIETLILKGYRIQEIDYRTPIREAFYILQTSRFVMGYDGMWHYLARMLFKPTVITGDNTIIRTHNPQAMCFLSPKKDKITLQSFIDNLENTLIDLDKKCYEYSDVVRKVIENR